MFGQPQPQQGQQHGAIAGIWRQHLPHLDQNFAQPAQQKWMLTGQRHQLVGQLSHDWKLVAIRQHPCVRNVRLQQAKK